MPNKRFCDCGTILKKKRRYCNSCRGERKKNSIKKGVRKYKDKNREGINRKEREKYHQDVEKSRELHNSKYHNNLKRNRHLKRKAYYKNREENIAYKLMKYRTDKQYNIKCRLVSSLRCAINRFNFDSKISCSRNSLVNYEKIIEHLKPFPLDIKEFQIDHIIPLACFDLTKDEHIVLAFNPLNLQWLKNEVNGGKRDKIDFEKYSEQGVVYEVLNLKGINVAKGL